MKVILMPRYWWIRIYRWGIMGCFTGRYINGGIYRDWRTLIRVYG